jgi:Flp pilus assembly protein TadB
LIEENLGAETPAGAETSAGSAMLPDDSLVEDVRHLVDDGKTYLEAEIQFQKTRAALVLDRSRSGAIYGVAALFLVHLALIGLVVGLVIALTPLITAWGATAVVAGILLAVAVLFALKAKRKFASISTTLSETRQ